MKLNKLKLTGVLVAGAMLGGLGAQANDQELLNTLVRKGYLTQGEASSMSQQGGATSFSAAGDSTTSLRFNGLVHMQYNYLSTKKRRSGAYNYNPPAQNNFQIRRLYLGVMADLFDDWGATVNGDFAPGNRDNYQFGNADAAPNVYPLTGGGTSGNFRLEKGIITWHGMEEFALHFGYMKVPFGYEETMDDSELKTIERSVSNNFFINQLGYGARHTGIYLKGDLGEMEDVLDGVYYGFGMTDPRQNHVDGFGTGRSNSFAWWGRLGFMSSFDEVGFNFGLNGGYVSDSRADDAVFGPFFTAAGAPVPVSRDWVYGIYANIDWEGLSFMAEFMGASLKNGALNSPTATGFKKANPVGFTLMPSYRFDEADFGDFEIVLQYSFVDSNGHGILPGAVVPGASSVATAPVEAGISTTVPQMFQRMHYFYFGGTWFILGNDVTFSAGFDYARFKNNLTAELVGVDNIGKTYVVGGRARLQLLF